MDLQQIKQRFGIIGGSPKLNHAIGIATQVAPTDISVLINGESGTGKKFSLKSFITLAPESMAHI